MKRDKLQLVGVTAMLIASKYEEMYAPEIADFVYITDNAYTKQEIRRMECVILRTLDFNLGRPLPLHFLRRNSKAGEVCELTPCKAKTLTPCPTGRAVQHSARNGTFLICFCCCSTLFRQHPK